MKFTVDWKKVRAWFQIPIEIRNVEKIKVKIGPGIIIMFVVAVGWLFPYISN